MDDQLTQAGEGVGLLGLLTAGYKLARMWASGKHKARMARARDREAQARLIQTFCEQVEAMARSIHELQESDQGHRLRIAELEGSLGRAKERIVTLERELADTREQLAAESAAAAAAHDDLRELRDLCQDQADAISVLEAQIQSAGMTPAAVPPKPPQRGRAPRKKAK